MLVGGLMPETEDGRKTAIELLLDACPFAATDERGMALASNAGSSSGGGDAALV